MNKKTLAVLAAVGLVVLLSVSVLMANMTNTPSPVDERGAMDAVEKFGEVGIPVSVSISEFPGQPDQYEVVTDKGATVWVDRTGRVRAVHGVVSRVTGTDLPMDDSEARKVAEAFLADHHPGFGSMVLSHTFWLSDDAVVFSWSEFAASGARLMREASLTVNCATGTLSSYVARYDAVEGVSTEPKVSADEVTETFRGNEERAGALVEECSLEVQKDAQGLERLVWRVTYRPMIAGPKGETFQGMGMSAFFDAETGEDITADFR